MSDINLNFNSLSINNKKTIFIYCYKLYSNLFKVGCSEELYKRIKKESDESLSPGLGEIEKNGMHAFTVYTEKSKEHIENDVFNKLNKYGAKRPFNCKELFINITYEIFNVLFFIFLLL